MNPSRKLNQQILHLAIPNIISNISVPLLGCIDTALVGHLDSLYFLGAVALGSTIFNFLYWSFEFLRMGTTGLTAQAFGQKNEEEYTHHLTRGLITALLGGLALLFFHDGIAQISFSIIRASSEVETFARQYFSIRIFAAPATLTLMVFTGWFLGMQNARYPLIITIFTNTINIVMDMLFVNHFHWEANGVALGTVIAQYSGLILTLGLFWKRYRFLLKTLSLDKTFHLTSLKALFTLNRDIFLRTLSLILVMTFFTLKSAEEGDLILATNTILLQLWMFYSYAIDGFAFAAESLIGRYYGAKDAPTLKKCIQLILKWGASLGGIFAAVFIMTHTWIFQLFTNQSQILLLLDTHMFWIVLAYLINWYAFIWDGIYIGLTAVRTMRNVMLVCAFIIFIPIYALAQVYLDAQGLWFALIYFMLMRGVLLKIFARDYIS